MTARVREDLLRELAPQVLGALVRRFGHLDTAEDAVQEALVAAAVQWPKQGYPDNPRAWLFTVASRKLADMLRADQARRRREDSVAQWKLPDEWLAPPADRRNAVESADDSLVLLVLLLMCCHPSLSPASQIALTLRAVGGLSTREIARAFLVPEETMVRRISRAKQRIKSSGIPFGMPAPTDRDQRIAAVLHALYLIFNEGYATTSGPALQRPELSAEAIRLTRMVHRLLPGDGEVAGLLALMLLTDARRAARTGPDGLPVPMNEQDRGRWDADGPEIIALYELLLQISDNPIVALNHAVAVAMAKGPHAGLDLLARMKTDERVASDHRFHAVRAHLLEMTAVLP